MTSRVSLGALVAASLVSLFPAAGVAAADPSPLGMWARGDGKAKVRVERCGSDICAVNTWIRAGTKGEKAGDVLVMSVKPDDPGHWSGTAFDRQRDLKLSHDADRRRQADDDRAAACWPAFSARTWAGRALPASESYPPSARNWAFSCTYWPAPSLPISATMAAATVAEGMAA